MISPNVGCWRGQIGLLLSQAGVRRRQYNAALESQLPYNAK